MTAPESSEARAAAVLAAHAEQIGGGGGLWTAKCLGCGMVASGAGNMLNASAAHDIHQAAALAAAGLLADPAPTAADGLREAIEAWARTWMSRWDEAPNAPMHAALRAALAAHPAPVPDQQPAQPADRAGDAEEGT